MASLGSAEFRLSTAAARRFFDIFSTRRMVPDPGRLLNLAGFTRHSHEPQKVVVETAS